MPKKILLILLVAFCGGLFANTVDAAGLNHKKAGTHQKISAKKKHHKHKKKHHHKRKAKA
jgi:hypothetical protein